MSKKDNGQFYTTNSSYILDGFSGPPSHARCILEPFAGKGDLLTWVRERSTLPIEAYDIEPKREDIVQRDTLRNPPTYTGAWILTNPPYLARNKCATKDVYDLYNTNDLYKCFLTSVLSQGPCCGGVLIVPAGFFFSPRDIDVRCRSDFMKKYKITKVKYFEERVFDDTTTTIVAFSFEESIEDLTQQDVIWELLPSKQQKIFRVSSEYNWIVGGEIYKLPLAPGIQIRRHVEGQPLKPNEHQTFMTLNALDGATRIGMEYKKDYVYPAKECSRTYATLRIVGKTLTEDEQTVLCTKFNEFLEEKRKETWSLFLPQYREYDRKRIPFELAYSIILHLIRS